MKRRTKAQLAAIASEYCEWCGAQPGTNCSHGCRPHQLRVDCYQQRQVYAKCGATPPGHIQGQQWKHNSHTLMSLCTKCGMPKTVVYAEGAPSPGP